MSAWDLKAKLSKNLIVNTKNASAMLVNLDLLKWYLKKKTHFYFYRVKLIEDRKAVKIFRETTAHLN